MPCGQGYLALEMHHRLMRRRKPDLPDFFFLFFFKRLTAAPGTQSRVLLPRFEKQFPVLEIAFLHVFEAFLQLRKTLIVSLFLRKLLNMIDEVVFVFFRLLPVSL